MPKLNTLDLGKFFKNVLKILSTILLKSIENSLKVLWKISAYIKFRETLGSPVGNLISCGKSARISNDPDGHLEDGEKRGFSTPHFCLLT